MVVLHFGIINLVALVVEELVGLEDRIVGMIEGLRPVYTGDFCRDLKCDFLLLEDVKEYITKEYCHRLTYI